MIPVSESVLLPLQARWRAWSQGSANRQILGAALTVGSLSLIVGLAVALKDLLVAYRFGTSDAVDAFFIAWLIPAFASMVAADSFSAALIPTYMRVREDKGPDAAAGVFEAVLGRSIAVLLVLSVVLAVTSHWTLGWIGGRFVPEKLALTRMLFLILLPAVLLNGVATIWSSVLNAGKRFAMASLAPIVVPVCAIVGLYLLGRSAGIIAVAVGTTVGYVIKAAWLGAVVRRRLGHWGVRWRGHQDELRAVFGQYALTACGAFLMASTLIVDQTMGARLPAGTVASLTYGMRIVTFVLGLASVALGTAVLPHLSGMVARSEWPVVRHTIAAYTRMALGGGAAAAIALFTLSYPIVALVYQRGAFTEGDVALVARIMAFNALQIPFFLLGTLLVRLAFALQRSHILLVGTLISVPLNVLLNWIFMKRWGAAGIALSTSCVYLVSATFLWIMLVRPLRRLGLSSNGLNGGETPQGH
jgi:putative peptidoglycan lipid II flippase